MPLTISDLVKPGVIGFHTHMEVTEIIASRSDGSAINLFTIGVAEDRGGKDSTTPIFLGKGIRVSIGQDVWRIGLLQYVKSIDEVLSAVEQINIGGEWALSGRSLGLSDIVQQPARFVPPDARSPVPLNRVLKNNFWNGSHVFEWADTKKANFNGVFSDPKILREISDYISKYIPIGLAGLSDRLGNLLIQIPVTIIMSCFSEPRDGDDLFLKVTWHPDAIPRPIRVTCEVKEDGIVRGYAETTLKGSSNALVLSGRDGPFCGTLWDEENKLILAVTGPLTFISSVKFQMNLAGREPRDVSYIDTNGKQKSFRVGQFGRPTTSIVGESKEDGDGGWTNKRIYKEELAKLAAEKRFFQYRPSQNKPRHVAHNEALADIRLLINRHGQIGAWLWDPYLCADDVIETLFHCVHSGSDLRALTDAREVPRQKREKAYRAVPKRNQRAKRRELNIGIEQKMIGVQGFIFGQRKQLDSVRSNLRGLSLEFRARWGQVGWPFHDRFLIFPQEEGGALVWSIGTSINGVGKEHHILQQVGNGQPIQDAFLDLWDLLDKPKNIIWKKP